MAHAPIVFISSTSEDLKDYRQAAAKAARGLGFSPLMMEDFPADGSGHSLGLCLREVEKAQLVIAIVAHRYGWVPNDTGELDAKSITWLECEHAWHVTKKEVLGFVVDPTTKWDLDQYENYRLIRERAGIGFEPQYAERSLACSTGFITESIRALDWDWPSASES